jgi:hypothetical protein
MLVEQYPDAEAQLRQLFKVLCDIQLRLGKARTGAQSLAWWKKTMPTIVKPSLGTYTVTLNELKGLLKVSIFSEEKGNRNSTGEPHQEEGFQEVRRRKRQNTDETAKTKKCGCPGQNASTCKHLPHGGHHSQLLLLPKNILDTDCEGAEAVPGKAGRPPPIILMAKIN